ncbi:rhodanese-like domain-containing protein [Propionivibrio dicarboxylicus]|uniref:Rhodanese-related sulfurtransferase n=1 Tax=Propionivibrio dicarboxylicus TaxID=83767 RepID=A0A1G7UWR6_9RHOO|nr:rhodanese-like domain-containing protein [Propionivibrio dicarboxylicus]SDG52045.1 Rhodanese-related sulfurtransferase [Propionivibrio dicarboxylicus]
MGRLLMRLLVLGWMAVLSMTAFAEVIPVDNATLARLMEKGVPLVDIRTEGEWRSTGIIAGSRTLTFFDERGQANPSAWLEQARRIAPPDRPLILVCRSGNRTREASRFLSEQARYRTVYHLERGLAGWVGEGRPLSSWR